MNTQLQCEEDLQIDMKKIQRGEYQEFEKFYHKYAAKIYNYAYKILRSIEDAEEMTQEIFSTIWTKRDEIQKEEFLWRLARCRCIDYLRKKKIPFLANENFHHISSKDNQQQHLILNEYKQNILDKCSKHEKQILQLLMRGFNRREISETLCIPIGTIDSRLHRLKLKWKDEL